MMNKTLAICASTMLLTACGGGGGGGGESEGNATPQPPSPTELTGTFIDSPVGGLFYETATRSGLTNPAGEFRYLEGETVKFYVGGTLLGGATGSEVITPFSLMGINVPDGQAQIMDALGATEVNSLDRAINIATLLQALDLDGNPDNGIDLGDAHQALQTIEVNLRNKATQFIGHASLINARNEANRDHTLDLDEVVTHLYDSLGVQVRSNRVATYSAVDNKRPVETVYYTYTSDGLVSTARYDRNSDGSIDNTKTFSYDSNGNMTQLYDSVSGSTQIFTYNNNNQITLLRVENDDGSASRQLYNYNTSNTLIRLEWDRNDDGSPERITYYGYDGENRLVNVNQDKDANGSIDASQQYLYNGNLVEQFISDENYDGTPDLTITYSYDGNGNKTQVLTDSTGDGNADSRGMYQYDSNQNMTRYEIDYDMDGAADYIEASKFNSSNLRSYRYRDSNGDGVWDRTSQFFYDRDGNQTRMIEDSDGNGIADKVWQGSYEPAVIDNAWEIILSQLDVSE